MSLTTCPHDDKSYAPFLVNEHPIKTPWICRGCGECGVDEGTHKYTGDYAETLWQFLEHDGNGRTLKGGSYV